VLGFNWVDAAGNYLKSDDGRYRVTEGLDQIAGDTMRAGAQVRWGMTSGDCAAGAYYWRTEIVLAPRLVDCEPDAMRYCLVHEQGRLVLRRRDDERVRACST
jgi:hypothetical protein